METAHRHSGIADDGKHTRDFQRFVYFQRPAGSMAPTSIIAALPRHLTRTLERRIDSAKRPPSEMNPA